MSLMIRVAAISLVLIAYGVRVHTQVKRDIALQESVITALLEAIEETRPAKRPFWPTRAEDVPCQVNTPWYYPSLLSRASCN